MTDIGPSYVRSADDDNYLTPTNIAVLVISVIAIALAIAAIVVATNPPVAPSPPPPPVYPSTQIEIIHFGNLFKGSGVDPRTVFVGLSKLATLVKVIASEPNTNTYVTFSGDMFTPSASFTMLGGPEVLISIMSVINSYANVIALPGDHEFGLISFPNDTTNYIKQFPFPWVLSNFYGEDNKTLAGFYESVIKKNPNDIDIGFIGLGFDYETARLMNMSYKYQNPKEIATRLVSEFKASNIENIIVLSHLPIDQERDLIRSVHGIDFCLGGQTIGHSIDVINNTFIIDSSSNLESVWHISFNYKDIGTPEQTNAIRYTKVDLEEVSNNAEVDQIVNKHYAATLNQFSVNHGVTEVDIKDGRFTFSRAESTTGDYVADRVLDYAMAFLKQQHEQTGRNFIAPVVALINAGSFGIANITLSAGDNITKREILDLLPYENTVAILEINYGILTQILENAVSALPEPDDRFLQVSGLNFSVACSILWPVGGECSAGPGHRISNIYYNDSYIHQSEDVIYLVTTNTVAKGNNGFFVLTDSPVILSSDTSDSLFDIVYTLLPHAPIHTLAGGRINELSTSQPVSVPVPETTSPLSVPVPAPETTSPLSVPVPETTSQPLSVPVPVPETTSQPLSVPVPETTSQPQPSVVPLTPEPVPSVISTPEPIPIPAP